MSLQSPRTLKELAQQALDVQDAANLSGVVISWTLAVQELRQRLSLDKLPCGTDDINRHPISMLWADKCASLTGSQYAAFDEMSNAYETVKKLAQS